MTMGGGGDAEERVGDMSPGATRRVAHVMSPAREYSQCDSGSDGDIGASGSPRRDDVLRDRAVNGGEKDQQTKKVFPIFRTGRKTCTWCTRREQPGTRST